MIVRIIEKSPEAHVAIIIIPGVGDPFPFSQITNTVPLLDLDD